MFLEHWEALFEDLYSIVKDPTSLALVQFGAGASPLRVALRTGSTYGTGASASSGVRHRSNVAPSLNVDSGRGFGSPRRLRTICVKSAANTS